MQVETKYTPEIYLFEKELQGPGPSFGMPFLVFSDGFFLIIFVCHFSPSASSILTAMLVMNLDHQAEWEFLNGGRNWKFEELRVVSVEQKDHHLDLWKGIPNMILLHMFFFPDFMGAREAEKDLGLGDISTDFLLRIVCLIRGLFW